MSTEEEQIKDVQDADPAPRKKRPTRAVAAAMEERVKELKEPEPVAFDEEVPEGSILVYVAVRKNDIPIGIEGGSNIRSKPGGWRIGLFSDRGVGMNYYSYPLQGDTATSEQLAVNSYALLKAVEFAHDKDVRAKNIIVRAGFPNPAKVTNNQKHKSAQFIFVMNKKLNQDWGGVSLDVQTVPKTHNKAESVAKQVNLPNYYTFENRNRDAAEESYVSRSPQQPQQRVQQPLPSPSAVHEGMSNAELREKINQIEAALEAIKSVLIAREQTINYDESGTDNIPY
jgi:hypothetical protein